MTCDINVIIPSAEFDREEWWGEQFRHLTFRDERAFLREAIFRMFSPPLSAIAIATDLARRGWEPQILDVAQQFGVPFTSQGIHDRYAAVCNWLGLHSARVATFISSLSAREHKALLSIAQLAKEVSPGTPVVLGGYHAVSLKDELIRSPHIDMILTGDFEPVADRLMTALVKRSDSLLAEVPNLVWKDVSGQVRINKHQQFKRDEIVSRFDFAHAAAYLGRFDMLGMVASKGCPFPCNFCQEHAMRTTFGDENPRRAAEAALAIHSMFKHSTGIEEVGFYFMDALFGARRGWLQSLCDSFVDFGSTLKWTFQTRVDLLELEDIPKLRAAGCYLVNVGVESLSASMLTNMNKSQRPERYLRQFQDLVEECERNEIDVEFNIVFGAPGETRRTLAETAAGIEEVLSKHRNCSLNLNLYRLFPQTGAFDSARDGHYGSGILVPEWWKKGVVPEITVTVRPSHDLTVEEVLGFYSRMYSSDICYRRRGSMSKARDYLASDGLTALDLSEIATSNRIAYAQKMGATRNDQALHTAAL